MSKQKTPEVFIEELQPPVHSEDINDLHALACTLSTRLTSSSEVRENVSHMVENADKNFYVARHIGKIVGSAMITRNTTLSKKTGFVDDIVVLRDYQGYGIGRRLFEQVVALADNEGLTLQLTSRPSRKKAIELYTDFGFSARETNVYERAPIA